jgi:hypothetical protein
MARAGWIFWKITDSSNGDLAWLGITRAGGRSATDRDTMRTLIPRSRMFVANWYVTEDYLRSPGGVWSFENIDVSDARDILSDLPDPSAEEVARITRPERVLTLDKIDRFEVLKVLGQSAQYSLRLRR